MNDAGHPPPDVLYGYEHQLLSPEEVRSVHDHIAVCAACRGKLAGALGLADMVADIQLDLGGEAAPRRLYARLAWAAAVLLLVGAASLYLKIRPPADVREALATGAIPLPGFLAELNPPREILMGSATADRDAVISPKGTAVLSPRPEFQWRPLPGSWTYKVQVFTVEGELAAESSELTSARWSPAVDLQVGVTYQWQVASAGPDGRMTLPKPPDTPPRFRVIEPGTARRIHGSALERAVEEARAGLMEAAHHDMELAIAEHPGDPALARLRQFLSK